MMKAPAATSDSYRKKLAVQIDSFDPRRHDRGSFSCGISRLDNFLKLSAKKRQAADFTRVWVATLPGRNQIIGYYALNAHRLEAGSLLPGSTRDVPPHGDIPAVYLSMIAVDSRHQGLGLGKILLADGMKRAVIAAKHIGLKAVVLNVIADGGPEVAHKRMRFYVASGFIPLANQPQRLFIGLETIRQAMS